MGHIGSASMHAYCSSKHGVAGLTKTLAAELGGHGICVNALEPGYVYTDLTQRLASHAEFEEHIIRRTPAGRWGRPRDMAGPAVFLCSDASAYVNGHTLVADGGMIETLTGVPSIAAIGGPVATPTARSSRSPAVER